MTETSIFQKCAPALRSNISQCGSVTLCANAKPETIGDLEDIYKKDGEYRILEHLLMTHFQVKACSPVQRPMRDFFMSNAKITRKGELKFDQNSRAITRVAPFIMAERRNPINNNYWQFTNGEASGNYWVGRVASNSGIPADVRSWPAGMNVYVTGKTGGGSKTLTQWVVRAAELGGSGTYVTLTLEDQNAGSLYPSATQTSPVTGVLQRGIVNVGKTESYCDDEPAYNNIGRVPYWMQHTRWTSCTSELYQEWLDLVMANNPLYRDTVYVPDVERQRQMLEAFENRLFNAFWFQLPLNEKQNLTEYDQLPEITNFISDTGLGVEGARCVGRRANAVGVIPQLRECDRWVDLQGGNLNIYSIFDAIYAMRRVRAGVGSAAQMRFDVFTDALTAEQFEKAFIGFMGLKFSDKDRYINDITRGQNEELGMQFTSFRLTGKNNGVVLNFITDWAFDDQLAEFSALNIESAGRTMMFLDMTGIYMKVIESSKQVNKSGDLKALALVDPSFACVEEVMSRDTTLNGLTFTTVVECPQSNLILDNFSDEVPVFAANTAGTGDHDSYLPDETVTPYV